MGVFSQKSYQKTSFLILWKEKNDFKRKKIKVLKRAKKWTFSKGVSPWILSKNRNFSYLCFSLILCQKTSFFDIYERKQSVLDQKIEVSKRANTWTSFKGVGPWIFSKNRTFTYRRFLQKSFKKTSFLILWKEKNDFKRKKK